MVEKIQPRDRVIDLERLPPGLALRLQRHLAGLTLQELGARIGVHAARLSEAERGIRLIPPEVMAKLEKVLRGAFEEEERR